MRPGTALLVIDDSSRDSGSGAPSASDLHGQPDVVRQVVEMLREAALLHEHDGRPVLAAAHRRRATALEQDRRERPHA